jgi:hypothetical protein
VEIHESIAVVHLEAERWSGKFTGSEVHMSDVFTLVKTGTVGGSRTRSSTGSGSDDCEEDGRSERRVACRRASSALAAFGARSRTRARCELRRTPL